MGVLSIGPGFDLKFQHHLGAFPCKKEPFLNWDKFTNHGVILLSEEQEKLQFFLHFNYGY